MFLSSPEDFQEQRGVKILNLPNEDGQKELKMLQSPGIDLLTLMIRVLLELKLFQENE